MLGYRRPRWPGAVNPGVRIVSRQSGLLSGTMTVQYQETLNVTVSAVDMSRAVLYIGGISMPKIRTNVKAKLTSATNVEIIVYNHDAALEDYAVYWELVEYENITVQRGEISDSVLATTTDTGTVAITGVSLADSFLVPTGCGPSANASQQINATLGLTAYDTISYSVFNADSVAQTCLIPWQVVTLEQ